MPDGMDLFGNLTSTQSALIVPNPADADLYYVFTVDKADDINPGFGLNYTEVDMRRNNGLGDVVPGRKNINLVPSTAEKVSAVKHALRNSYWVVSCDRNKSFYAFEVMNNGEIGAPVVSSFSGFLEDGRGYMKIAPGGAFLATANYSDGSAFLYRFDSNTGRVRQEQAIEIDSGFYPYGVEFSSDSRYLYISSYSQAAGISRVYQFNTEDASVNTSRHVIASDNLFRGALQIGIDGKIYRAQPDSQFLGVINNPNLPGPLCDYRADAVFLGEGHCKEGLPPFIQSFFILDIQVDDNCFGDPTTFSINSNQLIDNISWDFGDPDSGSGNNSDELNPEHLYSTNGTYTVSASVTFEDLHTASFSREVTIFNTPVANRPQDIFMCFTDPEEVRADLGSLTATVLGAQDPTLYSVSFHHTPGDAADNDQPLPLNYLPEGLTDTVYVRVQNRNTRDCYDLTQFTITLEAIQPVPIPDELYLCPGMDLVVDASIENALTYFWSDQFEGNTRIINTPGHYFVEIGMESGCTTRKDFEVFETPPPVIREIQTNGEQAVIIAESDRPLRFSLDNADFSESNRFDNLPPGIYTAFVETVDTCGSSSMEFAIFGFSKFFTPNSDGVNDIWDISSLGLIEGAKVSIYDRYGKLVSQLSPETSKGWNGMYNEKRMPASDYWYRVRLGDGREFQGHFALKR
jgi:gliding motility-associated-like protein